MGSPNLNNAKLAVHFGAGNIGRGFLGQLYFESGFHTTFVDVDAEIVSALHERGEYPLEIVDNDLVDRRIIGQVDALPGTGMEAVAARIAQATIVSTAVGANALPHIAPVIARGLALRFEDPDAAPLNILVCENLRDAATHFRAMVAPDPGWPVGFADTSIGRMVPVPTPEERAKDPLLVRAEPYCTLPVDATAFVGPPPPIQHLKPVTPFQAWADLKLYLHNMTHAAAAYLGYLRGHEAIANAAEDSSVLPLLSEAAAEIAAALAQRHGIDRATIDAQAADLLRRYRNRALGDTVARVARDPLRKLAHEDRLIGAARLCIDEGIPPIAISVATAAAVRYDHPNDPAAQSLAGTLREGGLAGVLEGVCGIAPDSPLAQHIEAGAERLNGKDWLRPH